MIEEVLSGDAHDRNREPRQGKRESLAKLQIQAMSQPQPNPRGCSGVKSYIGVITLQRFPTSRKGSWFSTSYLSGWLMSRDDVRSQASPAVYLYWVKWLCGPKWGSEESCRCKPTETKDIEIRKWMLKNRHVGVAPAVFTTGEEGNRYPKHAHHWSPIGHAQLEAGGQGNPGDAILGTGEWKMDLESKGRINRTGQHGSKILYISIWSLN